MFHSFIVLLLIQTHIYWFININEYLCSGYLFPWFNKENSVLAIKLHKKSYARKQYKISFRIFDFLSKKFNLSTLIKQLSMVYLVCITLILFYMIKNRNAQQKLWCLIKRILFNYTSFALNVSCWNYLIYSG